MDNPDKNTLRSGTEIRSPYHTYKIRSVLGRGGFGITYSATFSTRIGNLPVTAVVAIKEHFISGDCERMSSTQSVSYSGPSAQRVEQSRRDFVGEARRLQSIATNHPNIVQVSEVFDANNTSYYVMEYLEGQSLAEYVKANGALTEQQTMKIMTPLIRAVGYLHANRITHLDIKPANIMMVADNDGSQRPVLIDFGLSKHYNDDGSATSTINIQGFSEGYAPIEQYVGISTFSPQADVYSLAATILFCLTGRRPPKSIEMTPDRIAAEIPAGISPSLRDALTASFNMAQTVRPADANALLNRINGSANSQTVAATQPQYTTIQSEPTMPFQTSPPAPPSDTIYATDDEDDDEDPEDKYEEEPRKSSKAWLWFILLIICAATGFSIYQLNITKTDPIIYATYSTTTQTKQGENISLTLLVNDTFATLAIDVDNIKCPIAYGSYNPYDQTISFYRDFHVTNRNTVLFSDNNNHIIFKVNDTEDSQILDLTIREGSILNTLKNERLIFLHDSLDTNRMSDLVGTALGLKGDSLYFESAETVLINGEPKAYIFDGNRIGITSGDNLTDEFLVGTYEYDASDGYEAIKVHRYNIFTGEAGPTITFSNGKKVEMAKPTRKQRRTHVKLVESTCDSTVYA